MADFAHHHTLSPPSFYDHLYVLAMHLVHDGWAATAAGSVHDAQPRLATQIKPLQTQILVNFSLIGRDQWDARAITQRYSVAILWLHPALVRL